MTVLGDEDGGMRVQFSRRLPALGRDAGVQDADPSRK
jgi:hypothetical protein